MIFQTWLHLLLLSFLLQVSSFPLEEGVTNVAFPSASSLVAELNLPSSFTSPVQGQHQYHHAKNCLLPPFSFQMKRGWVGREEEAKHLCPGQNRHPIHWLSGKNLRRFVDLDCQLAWYLFITNIQSSCPGDRHQGSAVSEYLTLGPGRWWAVTLYKKVSVKLLGSHQVFILHNPPGRL